MNKNWIKVQQTLYNLNEFSTIDEPFFIQGSPGYWEIRFIMLSGTTGMWTFNSEHECKTTYNEVVKLLTHTPKFLE